jgi:hypothetical protein
LKQPPTETFAGKWKVNMQTKRAEIIAGRGIDRMLNAHANSDRAIRRLFNDISAQCPGEPAAPKARDRGDEQDAERWDGMS